MSNITNGTLPASPEISLKPQRRRISLAEKLRILKAADDAAPGMQGSVLRREGIYSSQLSTWRRQLKRGDLDAKQIKARENRRVNTAAAARRIAELEAENRKLRRHVARAELIGEIQKKAARLLGMDLESRESNDAS
jgi:transposase-like protein